MKLLVNFSKGRKNAPIIAQAVKDTGVLINVERAVIDTSEGEALIEVPNEQCKLVRDSLTGLGATVRLLEHGISLDLSECVDCGACEPVCPVEAIYYEDDVPEQWTEYTQINADFFAELGSPGGAAKVGLTENDPQVVKDLPPQGEGD